MMPRGPHATQLAELEYYAKPFGETKQAMKRVVQPLPAAFDTEKRLDYDTRTDDKPVYVAFSEYTFTSNTNTVAPATTDTWIVQKFTYDAQDRVTRIQVARGAWDDRATLF